MKRILLGILFFVPPILILVMAVARRETISATASFEDLKLGHLPSRLVALQKMGKAVVPMLQTELKTGDSFSKLKAAWALGQLGPMASNAIPDLIGSLDYPNQANLPVFSLQSLETIAPAQVDAIPKLLSKLSDPNLGVSNCAADLLNKIELARKANNISMPVGEYEYANAFLRASSQRVRIMGLQKLMQISPQDERVIAMFKTLLNDTNDLIRQQAAMFLKNQAAGGGSR